MELPYDRSSVAMSLLRNICTVKVWIRLMKGKYYTLRCHGTGANSFETPVENNLELSHLSSTLSRATVFDLSFDILYERIRGVEPLMTA